MEAVRQAKETTGTDLGWLLDATDDAVVTLTAGQTHLLAHRAVLMDRSPVLGAMLQQEASSGAVTIPDVEGPVLRQLVAYLYCQQAPQLPGTAPKLLAAADKYGLSGLKVALEQQVAAQLSVETAAAAAVLAIRHSCGRLREAAIAFIKSHTHQVMATRGWAEAVCMRPKDVVEISQLLSETGRVEGEQRFPAVNRAERLSVSSSPAAVDSGAPATQSDHSGGLHTATSAAPHSPPLDNAAVSRLSRPVPDRRTFSMFFPRQRSHFRQTWASPVASQLRDFSAEKNRKLMEAARRGAVGQLEALLAAGADVEARGGGMGTALHRAAAEGHEEAARRLLAAGAPVGARDWLQHTPLHVAAMGGHAAVVRLLLAAGADHGATDRQGLTPLHLAALWDRTEAAAALLEGGADSAARDSEGWTPLDIARRNSHRQVEQLLLQAGSG